MDVRGHNHKYKMLSLEKKDLFSIICIFSHPCFDVDTDLEPFTTYEYRVRGWNSFGPGSTDVMTVTTSEDKPWGLAPPRWSRRGERNDIVQLQWQAPARPNGECACLFNFLFLRVIVMCYKASSLSVPEFSCGWTQMLRRSFSGLF